MKGVKTMSWEQLIISSHIARDRRERCARINTVLNGDWGKIIYCTNTQHGSIYISDMGLCGIVNEEKGVLITCYLLGPKQAKYYYSLSNKHFPASLNKRIMKNDKVYFKLYCEHL